MNDQKVHFQHIMSFAFIKDESVVDTAKDICSVYGQDATSVKVCQLWFKRFINGNESLEDQEGRGCKSSDINDSLYDLVSSDSFLSSREMAETLHTSHTIILSHRRDLGKTLKYGRWLPHKLS